MPPCLIIAFREIKLAPLAGVFEDGTKQQRVSPPTELCSALLRFEEPIGRTLNLDIYHFPQILNRIF